MKSEKTQIWLYWRFTAFWRQNFATVSLKKRCAIYLRSFCRKQNWKMSNRSRDMSVPVEALFWPLWRHNYVTRAWFKKRNSRGWPWGSTLSDTPWMGVTKDSPVGAWSWGQSLSLNGLHVGGFHWLHFTSSLYRGLHFRCSQYLLNSNT